MKNRERGFALLAVIVLIAVISAAVAVTLDEAFGGIQSTGRIRAAEMLKSGLDDGLSVAIDRLAMEDPIEIMERAKTAILNDKWDMFDETAPGAGYMGARQYPPTGPYRNQYEVTIGLRPGQVTRAPTGEDVTASNGQIVEVQINVESIGVGMPATQERVSVGVVVPRRSTYGR